ncbi:MAG: hypothetical protein Kow0069_21170 [Promethearchaeota archaeon]
MVVDNAKVIIRAKAYLRILKHALRWGSNALDRSSYKECMGMLIGELGEGPGPIKDVIVHDAVPISHGGKVEVSFAPEDYVSFSYVDADFSEQGLFTVGWYHTHPGLTAFLSDVDVRNQLGFQTPNPSAIALVFDHTYLQEEGNLGFKIFRLDDPSAGFASEYHEVDWVVEAPDSFGFFHEGIKDVIEAVQSRSPVILEINETPDVFGDIQLPGGNAVRAKIPDVDVVGVLEAFSGGIQRFVDAFVEPILRFFNEWGELVSTEVIDANVGVIEGLQRLKDGMNKGVERLQGWFKLALLEKFDGLETFISDRLESLGVTSDEMLKKVVAVKEATLRGVTEYLEGELSQKVKELAEQVAQAVARVDQVTKNLEQVDLGPQLEALEKASEQLTVDPTSKVEELAAGLRAAIEEQLGKLAEQLDELKKAQADQATSASVLARVLDGLQEDVRKLKGGDA